MCNRGVRGMFLSSGEMAAHTPKACLTHSRFRTTTVAYSQGKFLTNAAATILPLSRFGMAQRGFKPTIM